MFLWLDTNALGINFSQKYSGLTYYLDLQIGFIGRLDYQKGIDLIKLIMPDLMRDDVQFVSIISFV
jgi:starch synthase